MRPHLVSLAAMGVDAWQAVTAMSDNVARRESAHRNLRPKMQGLSTAMWTEAVRCWAEENPGLPLRVHDPYSWVELVVHDELHVRMHKLRAWKGTTDRATSFQAQLPCPDLDRMVTTKHQGNVELIAHPTPARRGPTFKVHSRLGSEELFEPILVDPVAVTAQLQSWRDRRVPWLEETQRMQLRYAESAVRMPDHEAATLRPTEMQDNNQPQRPVFKPYRTGRRERDGLTGEDA